MKGYVVCIFLVILTIFMYLVMNIEQFHSKTLFQQPNLLWVNAPEDYKNQPIGSLSKEFDPDCKICDKVEPGKYHIITTFNPVTHPRWKNAVSFQGGPLTDQEYRTKLESRNIELLEVLQDNLNLEFVIAIHILFDHIYVMDHLVKSNLANKSKLVFHQVSHDTTLRHAIEYVQNYLFNITVMIKNQDIRLGEGFEKIEMSKLSNTAYALTRRGKQEKYCKMPDPCGPAASYIGSHDTYIYRQTRKYTAEELKIVDHRYDLNGIDNVMIYFLKNIGKYQVLNPCYVLFTYHVHCIPIRLTNRPRVNKNGISGLAPFTDKLE